MIDDDIAKLVERERTADLGRLEADIWRREAAFQARRHAMRRMAAWQGMVMLAAMIGSAGAGFAMSLPAADPRPAALMMPGERLAPSALLFGIHR
ncbi:MAG: hypothetical protein JSR91_01975 [Proteobacteria bacterium]|nr:hypothetical protein [Pseudomonadota bacterium]